MNPVPKPGARGCIIPMGLLLTAMLAGCQRDPQPTDPDAATTAQAAPAAAVPQGDAAAMPSPAGAPTPEPPRKQVVMEGIPSRIDMPPPATVTPPVAIGAAIDYGCESGATLRVAYGQGLAEVAWTGGERLRLNLQPADAGGGERYAGEGYQLRRLGSTIELQQAGTGNRWRCMEANASA